jgi:hypothetical protein
MPVIFDQVTGTVTPPANDTASALPPAPPPPQAMEQKLMQWLRHQETRLARVRAD